MSPPLPTLLVLTDRNAAASRPLVEVVRAAVDAGARAVILREKDLDRAERARLADELRPILHDAGGYLLVASDPTIAADGVHLAAADPLPEPRPTIVGRSCHDLAEVLAAQRDGCDYVTLSPIFATASKPGYGPALGTAALAEVAGQVTVPIYALAGIDSANTGSCLAAGATGVAVMGTIMQRPETTADILAATIRSRSSQEAHA